MNENEGNKMTFNKIAKIGRLLLIVILTVASMLYVAKRQNARKALKTLRRAEKLTISTNVWNKYDELVRDNKFKQIPDRILKEDVQRLLKKGAKIEDAPLNLFAQHGKLETIQLLLDNGADINQRNAKNGHAMLHVAAQNNDLKTTKFLLRQPGIDVNITDNGVPVTASQDVGRTPLFLNLIICYQHPLASSATAKTLIQNGALVDIPGASYRIRPSDLAPSLPKKLLRYAEHQKTELNEDINVIKSLIENDNRTFKRIENTAKPEENKEE